MEAILFIIIVLISINKDFLILERKFIPVIPGNDPKDLYNEEKQI